MLSISTYQAAFRCMHLPSFFAESALIISNHTFSLKALIIRLLTTVPLMANSFKILFIISVMADFPSFSFSFEMVWVE